MNKKTSNVTQSYRQGAQVLVAAMLSGIYRHGLQGKNFPIRSFYPRFSFFKLISTLGMNLLLVILGAYCYGFFSANVGL
jgi:hypothetical protein